MANKTILSAYLFIHLSNSSNCITEFSELTRTPSRKYIYFWKAMINTAAKKKFSTVMLLYGERILIDILKNQPPNGRNVNSYRKVLQKSCGRVGKRKYNINGISTALRRHFWWKLFAFFWGSWIIVTGPLEILNWCSEMLRMSTPD